MTRLSPLAFPFGVPANVQSDEGQQWPYDYSECRGLSNGSLCPSGYPQGDLVPLPDFGGPNRTYRQFYDKSNSPSNSSSTRTPSEGNANDTNLTDNILSKVNVHAQCPPANLDISSYDHPSDMDPTRDTLYAEDDKPYLHLSLKQPMQVKNAQQIISDYLDNKVAQDSARAIEAAELQGCKYCRVSVQSLVGMINPMPFLETTPEERAAILSLHERHCLTRLDAICVYCHNVVADANEKLETTVQRVLHQRVCSSNPSSHALCVFCEAVFKSTTKVSAIEQVFAHEATCKYRPENLCMHCGRCFPRPSGCGGASDDAMMLHNTVCPQNPANQSWCPYCGRNFRSTFEKSSSLLCSSHILNCGENPANRCSYCDMTFSGDPNSPDPMDQAAAKLRQHLLFIHGKKTSGNLSHKNGHSKRISRDESRRSSALRHGDKRNDVLCCLPEDSGPDMDVLLERVDKPEERASILEKTIRFEKRQILKNVKSIEDLSCLRLQLRKLQLKWHPDKRRQSLEADKLQREIFEFVMKCWERYLSVVK